MNWPQKLYLQFEFKIWERLLKKKCPCIAKIVAYFLLSNIPCILGSLPGVIWMVPGWTIPSPFSTLLPAGPPGPHTMYTEPLQLVALMAWTYCPQYKSPLTVAPAFDQHWLSPYSCPLECVHSNGPVFWVTNFNVTKLATILLAKWLLLQNCKLILSLSTSRCHNDVMTNPIKMYHDLQICLQSIQWVSTLHITLCAALLPLNLSLSVSCLPTHVAYWAAIQHC